MMSGVMNGRKVLVTGVRNKWSISWHIALSLLREGATLAFSVMGEREEGGVRKLLADVALDAPIFHCDATDDEQITSLFEQVHNVFDGTLDGLVHGMAYANREELSGEFISSSKSGMTLANDCSVYTLVSLARGARPLLRAAGGGSIVTLTYLGAERVVTNYNAMGVAKAGLEASVRYLASDLGPENIRVNAVSAGPLKTLSASGIKGFDTMLKQIPEKAPLRRQLDADEVGDAALFLLSPWARGITGEVLHVDLGYNIIGL